MSKAEPSRAEGVDDEPEPMALPVALQGSLEQLARLRLGHVVGINEQDGVLAAELPEETLLGDRLGDPSERPRLDPRGERRTCVARLRPVPSGALRLRELFAEAERQATKESRSRGASSSAGGSGSSGSSQYSS